MKFKILEKFFRKKEDKKEERAGEINKNLEKINKILYKDLEAFIKKKHEKNEAAIKEKAMPFIDECIESIKNMRDIVEEIKNEEIVEIDKRIEQIVQTNKLVFVKIMENVLNTSIDKNENISEIKSKIFKITQTCGEADIQYGRYVSIAHSQMEDFRKNLKMLVTNAIELEKISMEQYEEYKILDEKYKNYINEKKRKEEIENSLIELEKELNINLKNLNEIKNSEKFKLLNNLLNEQSKIFIEKEEIEARIYSKIFSIERILKKIRRKNNIKEISLYIENPMIFLERDDYEFLNFLKLPADLNKEEQEKIIAYKKGYSDMINEKKRYKEILEREKRINEYIKKFDIRDEIKRIETNIKNISVKIEENKKEAEKFEKNIQNLKIEILEIKKKLEDKLNVEIEMEF